MGHSFVELGDRGVWLNDGHLTLIRHFVEREGRRLLGESAVPVNVRRSFERFLEGFVDYGPGVFCVDFGPMMAGGEGQRDFLLGVFDRVARALREFGGAIPLAYLEREINTLMTYFVADVPTGPILRALGRVWGLFTEPEAGSV